jgi:hypothetical protein
MSTVYLVRLDLAGVNGPVGSLPRARSTVGRTNLLNDLEILKRLSRESFAGFFYYPPRPKFQGDVKKDALNNRVNFKDLVTLSH